MERKNFLLTIIRNGRARFDLVPCASFLFLAKQDGDAPPIPPFNDKQKIEAGTHAKIVSFALQFLQFKICRNGFLSLIGGEGGTGGAVEFFGEKKKACTSLRNTDSNRIGRQNCEGVFGFGLRLTDWTRSQG